MEDLSLDGQSIPFTFLYERRPQYLSHIRFQNKEGE